MIKYVCDICKNDIDNTARPLQVASVTNGVNCFIGIKVQKENPRQPMKPIEIDVCAACVIELLKTRCL